MVTRRRAATLSGPCAATHCWGIGVTPISARTGTREALAEQLRLGQELRSKVERPASDSEGSTDASDASDASGDEHGAGTGAAMQRKSCGGRSQPAYVRAAALDLLQGGRLKL